MPLPLPGSAGSRPLEAPSSKARVVLSAAGSRKGESMTLDLRIPTHTSVRRTTRVGPSPRVLVAEDDEETRDMVVTAFVEDGYDVYGLDGEEGLTECLGIIALNSLRAPDLIAVG